MRRRFDTSPATSAPTHPPDRAPRRPVTPPGYHGLLVAFAVVCLALATKAFGAYQKQV